MLVWCACRKIGVVYYSLIILNVVHLFIVPHFSIEMKDVFVIYMVFIYFFSMDVLIGDKFNNWTAITKDRSIISRAGYKKKSVLCCCVCGKEKEVQKNYLINGNSKSCGCVLTEKMLKYIKRNTKHNMSNSILYMKYSGAKGRCNNKKAHNYRRYGGRGIKILWDSFNEFNNDMGESYLSHVKTHGAKNTTLDRIDNNGHYCKENCRRDTRKQQSNNRESNRNYSYKGETKNVTQRENHIGSLRGFIDNRLRAGWSFKDAIEIPKLTNGISLNNYKQKN